MEDTLGVYEEDVFIECVFVLILVLMEDTLGVYPVKWYTDLKGKS